MSHQDVRLIGIGSSFPTPGTTGVPVGETLTTISGNHTYSTAGGTLTNKKITGQLTVNANNVTVKNCWIQGIGENDWMVQLLAAGITMQDCEIGIDPAPNWSHAIGFYSGGSSNANVVLRCYIHGVVHGGRVDGGTTVQDCYIGPLPMGDPVLNLNTGVHTDEHTNALMMTQGGNNIIRHNTLRSGNTSVLFWQDGGGTAFGEQLVENNWIYGETRNGQQPTYGVFADPGHTPPCVMRVKNNVFNADNTYQSGYAIGGMTYTEWSGNTYAAGGTVPPP